MNRNDLAVPATFSSYGGIGGERALMTHPRSPKKSSMSPSPSSRKKSVSSMFGGTGSSGVPPTSSSIPKAAPLFEEVSVHVALPSFHQRAGTSAGGWKCIGCSHENHSALSNECSVCGMTRALSQQGSQVISESSGCSEDSFQYDGNGSENSLSLHNSFSAIDPNLGDEIGHANYSFGHASLPVGLNSSVSSLQQPTQQFHQSFSLEQYSRPVRPSSNRNNRNARRLGALRGGGGLFDNDQDQGHSSVRSFSDWNGNEKIKSWQCPTCTFVNENSLNLACEMCGHVREQTAATSDAAASVPVSVPTTATIKAATTTTTTTTTTTGDEKIGKSETNTADDDDAYLEELRKEQIRELVTLQQEIWDSIEHEGGAGNDGSAFQTQDLDREIGQIQAELVSSSHTGTQQSLGLDQLDHSDEGEEDDEDDETRLQELLANQMEIMKEFQQGRERASPQMDKKPPATIFAAEQQASAALPRATANQFHHDPLFGGSASNTAPQFNTAISLKESMQAAGGKLRIEDICVPLLWGENLPSTKQASGQKIQS